MDKYNRIAIRSVDPKIAKDLIAIAKNKKIPLSGLLRPYLRKIRDSFPEEMRTYNPDKDRY
tara:strand:- start:392 stop:574 length:183 start_codon:yes stop_codon:yes gene_type:complete